jgi:DNA-binding beta-propeller fold protein YncE
MAIVFPCPHCGATQSVNDDETATQCQFCGNSITVPEALRPKNAAPAPTPAVPQAISFAGLAGFPGMSGLPLNLDINKLRALGHAVRAGDKAQAAQLYQDIFGVDSAQAQQMVEAMLAHHGAVFQMSLPPIIQTGNVPPVFQMGSPPPAQPAAAYTIPAPGYITPATPMMVTGQRSGGRSGAACITIGLVLLVTVIVAGAILAAVLFSTPGALSGVTGLFNQASNQYPRVVMTFGGKGSGQGLFSEPRSIAVDGDGAIYVADYSDGRVQVFDSQGKFARQFKITDEAHPYVMALATGAGGKLYAVVSGGLYAYDRATGKSLGKVDLGSSLDANLFNFTDVAIRPGGGLAAASFSDQDNVLMLNSDLQTERVITDAISQVSGNPELDMHLAIDGRDGVFLLGTFANAVFHYDANGQFANRFGSEGGQTGQFEAPSDIAVDGQGQVYVSDDKGIQVFWPDGHYLSTIGMPDQAYLFGMTFDVQGALYAISNNGQVYKILVAPPK